MSRHRHGRTGVAVTTSPRTARLARLARAKAVADRKAGTPEAIGVVPRPPPAVSPVASREDAVYESQHVPPRHPVAPDAAPDDPGIGDGTVVARSIPTQPQRVTTRDPRLASPAVRAPSPPSKGESDNVTDADSPAARIGNHPTADGYD